MALSSGQMQEIRRKAELGIPLINPTPEAQRFYNQIVEIKRKAAAGIPLVSPNYWSSSLYAQYGGGSAAGTGGGNIGQGSPVSTGGSATTGGAGGPVLDQTTPVIVEDTGSSPFVPVGTGQNSSVNKLELNSILTVVVGVIFMRGVFKVLTKLF